eukprot:252664-Pleurochrysis_carterae.AAC.1
MPMCDGRVHWHPRVHARERDERRVSRAGAHESAQWAVRRQVRRRNGNDGKPRKWNRAVTRRWLRTPPRRIVEAVVHTQSYAGDCAVRPPRKSDASQ